MIEALFYWTGALVWSCIGGAVAWLLIEVFIGLLCAISFCRWALAVGREQGVKMFKRPIKAFFTLWFDHIGYRNNGLEKTWGPGGYWRGIGDSVVLPRVAPSTHDSKPSLLETNDGRKAPVHPT